MTRPQRNVVFVFGSNLAGIHGAGAAKEAALYWGAQRGVGVGFTGNSYALPTKDHHLRTLPLPLIVDHFERFMAEVRARPDTIFLLTPVGCGLAGYDVVDMAAATKCFVDPPQNLWFTGDWYR